MSRALTTGALTACLVLTALAWYGWRHMGLAALQVGLGACA
jgi:hypothetical protein